MSDRMWTGIAALMLLAGCAHPRPTVCGIDEPTNEEYRGRAALLEKWPPVRFETQHGDEVCRAIWRNAFYDCFAEWDVTHHGVVLNPGTDNGVAFAPCGESVRVCGVMLSCECMKLRPSARPWEDRAPGPRATEHY